MLLIEDVLFYYFSVSVLYTLVLSVSGKFYRTKPYKRTDHINRIVILVPCYKEDEVIVSAARKLSELRYPKEFFDVVVIADSLRPETIEALSRLPIITVPVKFDVSTKTKSLNVALNSLTKPYDIAIINDADNIVQPDFIEQINDAYNAGHPVIQAQRVAKNLNTPFAILDAASEIINNHLFRKGPNALGLSASIIGSGMAYPFALLKQELSQINSVGGFDKVLQLNVMERGIKIHYLEGVLVFDEKIESAEAFQRQRKRWLSSHFIYARKFFFKGIKLLFKGNFSYFLHAVLYNLFPPRVLLLFCLFALSLIFSIIFYTDYTIMLRWWSISFIYIIALMLPIPARFYGKDLLRAVLHLPTAILKMFQALFNLKGADDKFIHTKHSHADIDHSVFNKIKD